MGTWVPLKDAAGALGVSEITLKRRIKTGQLPARKEPSAKGFRWFIELPDEPSPDPSQTGLTQVERQLSEIITLLRDELGARRKEISELHIIIDNLTHQQPLQIEAPRTPSAPHTADASPDTSPEQSSKEPWWKRLW